MTITIVQVVGYLPNMRQVVGSTPHADEVVASVPTVRNAEGVV